jgi:restriction system protein
MVQAARSCRQNIAEGSRCAATSSQTELRLVNVARSSFEELLLDYEDYLRHRRLSMWDSEGREAMAVRNVPKNQRRNLTDMTDLERWELYTRWLESPDAAICANATICLIHQANFLLDQQIAALEEAFIEDGGYSEQLAAERLKARRRSDQADRTDPLPKCPKCGRLWRCGRRKRAKTKAANSGAARVTRTAKARLRFRAPQIATVWGRG